jgi:hypothetical protein
VGGAFHLIAGPTAIVIGQPNLRMQMIGECEADLHGHAVTVAARAAKQAIKAAARLSGVFALYSVVKCTVESAGYAASAPFAGGAVAVAVPFALSENRRQFLQAYFKETVKGSATMSRALAVSAGAVSGACMFGMGSVLLDWTGLNWV